MAVAGILIMLLAACSPFAPKQRMPMDNNLPSAFTYSTGPLDPSLRWWKNFEDPELDRLFAEGRAETDPEARAAIYQQVCTIMNEQVYWAPMWVTTRFGGVSTAIENFIWTPAPGGGRYFDDASSWSLAS